MSLQPIEMDADEARERVERVGAGFMAAGRHSRAALNDIVTLWRGRAWVALGYGSWDELCRDLTPSAPRIIGGRRG